MTTRGSNTVFQWLRLRHSMCSRLLNERNVGPADHAVAEPLQRCRNQLRPIVHPQHPRRAARRGEPILQLDDQPTCRLVVEDAHQQRRPIFLELIGGMFHEWN
jgi:hypothetical protein